MNKEKRYTAYGIAKLLGIKTVTASQRFRSPYAKERWGVESRVDRYGYVKRYVPEHRVDMWREHKNYMGRPVFKNNFSKKKNGTRH